jgi:hypothetical protein
MTEVSRAAGTAGAARSAENCSFSLTGYGGSTICRTVTIAPHKWNPLALFGHLEQVTSEVPGSRPSASTQEAAHLLPSGHREVWSFHRPFVPAEVIHQTFVYKDLTM